ncbi:asparaginase domain-containing protein [Sulfurimonas sp.]|uniref:asparaginase domain-containing protein n=1 Tax=Sulfurimonas sp. TaxID=2022749 RepID=UPI002639CD2D|nr:asparaginase domain-containing protein [Sulfurimonas sp.]
MLILNSGGTFNKRYNQLTGELEVPYDNYAIEKILESVYAKYDLAGVVYKDSLDMSVDDRKMIANIILESSETNFLVVHGTDTMHLSAEFLDEVFDDRIIVLTGAMKPFEIDNIEATLNLGIAMGFLKSATKFGVYICMNGYIEKWDKIEKNRDIGKFEIVR